MTAQIKIEISGDAAKMLMAGVVLIGIGYVVYKIVQNYSDEEIPLPEEAKDFAKLPEVSPSSVEELGFHQDVKKRAAPLLKDGHNVSAVREASVALFDVIRRKSGLNGDATDLVTRAFRSAKRTLKFADVAPAHIENAEDGLLGMLEGFAKYVRKIHAHASIEISFKEALLMVNVACYLAEQVENHAERIVEEVIDG